MCQILYIYIYVVREQVCMYLVCQKKTCDISNMYQTKYNEAMQVPIQIPDSCFYLR